MIFFWFAWLRTDEKLFWFYKYSCTSVILLEIEDTILTRHHCSPRWSCVSLLSLSCEEDLGDSIPNQNLLWEFRFIPWPNSSTLLWKWTRWTQHGKRRLLTTHLFGTTSNVTYLIHLWELGKRSSWLSVTSGPDVSTFEFSEALVACNWRHSQQLCMMLTASQRNSWSVSLMLGQ